MSPAVVDVPKIKLNNGVEIPAIGLGTWQSKPEEVSKAVEHALKEGYRHLDCAWGYMNEKDVSEGIRRSGVPRSEIFITSKVWPTGAHDVEAQLDQTLASLGTDYLDLYLVHWPLAANPNGNHPVFPTRENGTLDVVDGWSIADTWKQMEAILEKGKVRTIGVSNASEKTLEQLLPTVKVVPAVNQIECHLYNPEHELRSYTNSKGIVTEAYSPLGSTNSPILNDEVATEIAESHGLKTSDILLGYLLTKGLIVLPKSVTPSRISSNLKGALSAFKALSKDEVEKLDKLAAGGKQKRVFMPDVGGFDLGFRDWPGQIPLNVLV